MSPGTSSAAGMIAQVPSRRTDAFSASFDFSAATVAWARLSWKRPSTALNTRRPAMTAASLQEPYSSDTEVEPGVEGSLDPEKGKEERALALFEEDLRSEYRNCRICFRIRTPFEQIVHRAENVNASLIVMSSHSYGWLDRIVHGSAAEMILHSTPCPVLVVKEAGKAQRWELAETSAPK
jgi:nucleotide-binding universal stress UspA family protein